MIDRSRIEEMKSNLPAMWGEERFTGNGPVRPPREGFVPLPPPSDSAEPDGLARITCHVADKEDSQRKSFATQMLVDKTADTREREAARKAGKNALRGKHPCRSADAQPCPYCGSQNTWSKSKTGNGKRRRVCKEPECGRSFLVG